MTEDELRHPLAGFTGKNGRPRNRRRVTADHLRQIKRWAGNIVARWEVESTIYVAPADRAPGSNAYLRPREQHEYPENDPREWQRLADYMAVIAARADQVRAWALEQHHLTEKRLEKEGKS